MEQRKQNWDDVFSFIIILFIIVFLGDWLFYNGIVKPEMRPCEEFCVNEW